MGKLKCRSCSFSRVVVDTGALGRALHAHMMATGHTDIGVHAATSEEIPTAGLLPAGDTLQYAIEQSLLDDDGDD